MADFYNKIKVDKKYMFSNYYEATIATNLDVTVLKPQVVCNSKQ